MCAARFSLINLGCPKNTVDSEGLLGAMALAGFVFTDDPLQSDVCLVNTCGFLEASRGEAAEVLEGLATARGRRSRPLIVATGCLVERAGGAPELAGALAAADVCVGFADYPRLPEICAGLFAPRPVCGYAGDVTLPRTYLAWLSRPRMRIGSAVSAYLKLGEGCSNCCAYCAIPLIRGRRVSRSERALEREACELAASGVGEFNLIAQDVTAYGMDRSRDGRPRLIPLLERLLKAAPNARFRLLYAHPRHLTSGLLDWMAAEPRMCAYLDLPLQHVSTPVLRRMRRGYGRARVEEILSAIRRKIPFMTLRTTFITGHPGETEEDFAELLEFVRAGHVDHMGAFAWSPEPGTLSAGMKTGRVPPRIAEQRRNALMAAQRVVSRRHWREKMGQQTMFFAEQREGGRWAGRADGQAPEVDGGAVLTGDSRGVKAGDWIRVRIVRATDYDCEVVRCEG